MEEYICGDCGAQIGMSDLRCIGCGAPHNHAVAEKPQDEAEPALTRGSFGFWALGGVLCLAAFALAFYVATQAG